MRRVLHATRGFLSLHAAFSSLRAASILSPVLSAFWLVSFLTRADGMLPPPRVQGREACEEAPRPCEEAPRAPMFLLARLALLLPALMLTCVVC